MNRLSAAFEVFGCTICGLLVLAACEAGFDGRWLIERNWRPAEIGLCTLAALMIGQVLSSISRRLLDDWFIGDCLSRRGVKLLSREDHVSPRRLIGLLQFCNFYRTMCLGLVVVATILLSGIVWHNLVSSWGQADWRRLGYAALALLEAVAMLFRYLKFRRRHAQAVLSLASPGVREMKSGATPFALPS